MTIRLPNLRLLSAALLAALVLYVGSALPGAAHGGHHHGVLETDNAQHSGAQTQDEQKLLYAAAELRDNARSERVKSAPRDESSDRSPDSNCCCAGALCHAGAVLASSPELHRNAMSEIVRPLAVANRRVRLLTGIERPPRQV